MELIVIAAVLGLGYLVCHAVPQDWRKPIGGAFLILALLTAGLGAADF